MVLVTSSISLGLVLPKSDAIFLIFLLAATKAFPVVLNYMQPKYGKPLPYALAIVPLLIVAVLLFALLSDFASRG